ncbi:MAG: hypothetical protein K6F50_05335 [Kiritimatiellae bacterium]|nr:hypothetical protein [Kiritimatiellia bacterium]
MTLGSVVVLAAVVALAGFAVWRNLRKGAPCSCGCSGKDCACKGGSGCKCHG